VQGLVNDILALKKVDPAADVSILEARIDALVYELYHLTDAEIALIEGQTAGAAGGPAAAEEAAGEGD
jgi:ribosomal protein L12E/L44/L45/RPP1/RPP2